MQNDDFWHFWTTWFGGGLIDRFMGPILTQNVHFEQNLQLLFRGQRVPDPKMWSFAKAWTLFGKWWWPQKWQNQFWTKNSKCAKIDVFGTFQKTCFFTFCSFLAQSFKNVMIAKMTPTSKMTKSAILGYIPKLTFTYKAILRMWA